MTVLGQWPRPHWGKKVRSVRIYLRKYDVVPESAEAELLVDCLSPGWRALIAEHGIDKVFMCLRCEMTYGGALFYLREGRTA